MCEPECESSSKEDRYSNVACWAVSGDAFFPCEETVEKLPAGYYIVSSCPQRGLYFERKNIDSDVLLELPDSASQEILGNIHKFWKSEKRYRDLGFLWKRGILMWGPPGSGKTCTVQMLCRRIVAEGGIAMHIFNPHLGGEGLSIARKIEPKRPIVAVLEDIDAIVASYGEADLLAILDGEHQVDNIVFVATTNYPERLDGRLVNRPSRFDIVRKIAMPTEDARRFYLTRVHPRFKESSNGDHDMLDQWVKDTDDLSIAHIKELIVATEVFDSDYDESLQRLREMARCESHSDDYDPKRQNFGLHAKKKVRGR
jgi:SpoVK/Ycf46/Vps4 family AAA+-type ATPase